MNMKILMLFLIPALWCMGCDPLRRFQLKNETGSEAGFMVKIREDSIHKSPFYLSNEKEVRFIIYPGNKGRINLSCGEGSWTNREIRNLADDLELMQLKWQGGELTLTEENDIIEFLLHKRKGLHKRRIVIILTN